MFKIAELNFPRIIKRDGRYSMFDKEKLRASLLKVLEKRTFDIKEIEAAIQCIIHKFRAQGEYEVSSQWIGELVIDELRAMNEIAYVRFASVYRSFQNINAFHDEIRCLQKHQKKSNDVI